MGEIYNEASKVSNADGTVFVDGPDAVAVALTPEAAMKTANDLIEHAAAAKGDKDMLAEREKREGRDT